VLRKPDGVWVEPGDGRVAITRQGQPVTAPFKLQPGDAFEVGMCRFEYKE
jgi:hypothetical protein